MYLVQLYFHPINSRELLRPFFNSLPWNPCEHVHYMDPWCSVEGRSQPIPENHSISEITYLIKHSSSLITRTPARDRSVTRLWLLLARHISRTTKCPHPLWKSCFCTFLPLWYLKHVPHLIQQEVSEAVGEGVRKVRRIDCVGQSLARASFNCFFCSA